MPLDTTISGPNSDSYADLTYADAYLNTQPGSAVWTGAEPADKEDALRLACRRLDQEQYKGARAVLGQRLRWPRDGVTNPDGPVYEDWGLYEDLISRTEIPRQIKDAQCLLALAILQSNATVLSDQNSLANLKRVQLPGGFEVEFKDYQIESGSLPADVNRLIVEFLVEDTGLILRS